MKKKNKNISKKVPIGRTVQTRDEFFQDQGSFRKSGYEDKGYYRRGVAIETNDKDELAIVKLYGNKGTILVNYEKGQSGYKAFVETLDDSNKPIKIGRKFIENKPKRNVSKTDVNNIKKKASKMKKSKEKLRKLKGRKT